MNLGVSTLDKVLGEPNNTGGFGTAKAVVVSIPKNAPTTSLDIKTFTDVYSPNNPSTRI